MTKINHTQKTFTEKTIQEFREKFGTIYISCPDGGDVCDHHEEDIELFFTKALQEAEKIGMEKGFNKGFEVALNLSDEEKLKIAVDKKLSELKAKENNGK